MNLFQFAVCLAFIPVISAQTKVDLRSQSRNVDFSQASSTKPVKTGTVLPENCSIGELFYLLPGQQAKNLYGCNPAGTWVSQSLTLVPGVGTIGGVIVTSGTNSANVDIDPTSVMTMSGNNQPFGNMTPAMGNWDLAQVDSLMLKNSTVDPPSCAIGEVFINTLGTPELKTCKALNTWSSQASNSGLKTILNTTGTPGVPGCAGTPVFSYSIPANTFVANSTLDVEILLKHTGTSGGSTYWASISDSQVTPLLTIATDESWASLKIKAFLAGDGTVQTLSQTVRQDNTTGFDYRSAAVDVTAPIVFTVSAGSCVGSDTAAVDWISLTTVR